MEVLVIVNNVAVKDCSPESTFDSNICRVENDNMSDKFHAITVAG